MFRDIFVQTIAIVLATAVSTVILARKWTKRTKTQGNAAKSTKLLGRKSLKDEKQSDAHINKKPTQGQKPKP